MDFYKYTYLYANSYLNKFRALTKNPNLTYGGLSALLKTLYNRIKFRTYKDEKGNTIYAKCDLDLILNDKILRGMVMDILHGWSKKKESNQTYEPIDYSSDDEDMQKVSDKLVYDDNYGQVDESKKRIVKNDKGEVVPEKCDVCGEKVGLYIQGEPVYLCSKCGKYFGTMPCHIKEGKKNIYITEEQMRSIHNAVGNTNMAKRIIISEKQERELKDLISENCFIEPEKVKIVKKFLDETFTRGSNPVIGDDGYPSLKPIVGIKIKGTQEIAKPLSPSQAFYMIQDRFKDLYSDRKVRDAVLKQILIDWYNKKITNDGILSKNWV